MDEEILRVALACFMEKGDRISTQTIANRLGLSQPALFKRFGPKEELFLAAFAPPVIFPELDWMDAHPTYGPIKPQLQEMVARTWQLQLRLS